MSKPKYWVLSKERPHEDLRGLIGAAKKDGALDQALPQLNCLWYQWKLTSGLPRGIPSKWKPEQTANLYTVQMR